MFGIQKQDLQALADASMDDPKKRKLDWGGNQSQHGGGGGRGSGDWDNKSQQQQWNYWGSQDSTRTGGSGGRGYEKDSHAKAMEELTVMQARLSLRNSRDISELKAQVQSVILFASDEPVVKLCLGAQRWYGEQVAGKPGHGLGAPDMHTWRALLMFLAEQAPEEADRAYFQKHLDEKAGGVEAMQGKVIVAIMTKTGTPDKKKLTSVRGDEFEEVVEKMVPILAKLPSAEPKYGRGPRTGLEREVQTRLDRVTGKGRGRQ